MECQILLYFVVSCSYYVGALPYIVVADIDMLKEIMVKQAHKFVNVIVSIVLIFIMLATSFPQREPSVFTYIRMDNNMGAGLLFETGDEWKHVRRIVTPTFSGKKLKLVNLFIPMTKTNDFFIR